MNRTTTAPKPHARKRIRRIVPNRTAPFTNSVSDPGLTAGTSYRYQVRAIDASGNLSGYSNIASATTTSSSYITAYGMNEGSGTTLADASGSGHTGTLVNGPAWVAGQATYGQAL